MTMNKNTMRNNEWDFVILIAQCDASGRTGEEDAKERCNAVDEESADVGWNIVPVLFQEAAGIILHLNEPGKVSITHIPTWASFCAERPPVCACLFYLSSVVHDGEEGAMAPHHLKVRVGFEFAVQLVDKVSICGLHEENNL